jgi:hypothetical protein
MSDDKLPAPIVECIFCGWRARYDTTIRTRAEMIEAVGVLRKQLLEHVEVNHPEEPKEK